MKGPWLLLDVSYLAYRAYFSMGKLSHNQIATGVVYGVLREVIQLQETFNTTRVAFCFDHGKPIRSKLHPGYKSSRHENKTEAELEAILEVKEQIGNLRKDYLPQIGFRNIVYQKGYEADDIIAKIAIDRPGKDFVIVSSDADLFQLLRDNVRMWNPHRKEVITNASLEQSHGISAAKWAEVKALTGCGTDDVPGIAGVGEKTAIKYLRGVLTKGAALAAIKQGKAITDLARQLVTLPFPGMSPIKLHKDSITPDGWAGLIDRLGMNSLAASIPGVPRRKSATMTRASLGVFKAGGRKNG